MSFKRINGNILLDFDGTVHAYTTKFETECVIADGPVIDRKTGMSSIEWIKTLFDNGYQVTIFSTRCHDPNFRYAADAWFHRHGLSQSYRDKMRYSLTKEDHFVIIDDRAIGFRGYFPSIQQLKEFKPWHKF